VAVEQTYELLADRAGGADDSDFDDLGHDVRVALSACRGLSGVGAKKNRRLGQAASAGCGACRCV
jgi:hypothetical protein